MKPENIALALGAIAGSLSTKMLWEFATSEAESIRVVAVSAMCSVFGVLAFAIASSLLFAQIAWVMRKQMDRKLYKSRLAKIGRKRFIWRTTGANPRVEEIRVRRIV